MNSSSVSTSPTSSQVKSNLPALPPRPSTNNNLINNNYVNSNFGLNQGLNYQNLGNSFPFAMNNYNYGYNGFNSYGFNRFPYPYGNITLPESDLVRLAEERSRTAFQSIESFVQAFQSISMMLESSYMALASSFRAVLGVAEHLSRLKAQISTILINLTIIRAFKKYVQKLLSYIGLIRGEKYLNLEEQAWKSANVLANENTITPEIISSSSKSSWPIVAFFTVALGTPYLVYSILQNILKDYAKMESNKWSKGEGEHFLAVANFDFIGEGGHHNGDKYFKELSFKTGDQIIIAPKEFQRAARGWLLASLNSKIGLVPYNYLSQPVKVNNEIETKIDPQKQSCTSKGLSDSDV